MKERFGLKERRVELWGALGKVWGLVEARAVLARCVHAASYLCQPLTSRDEGGPPQPGTGHWGSASPSMKGNLCPVWGSARGEKKT